MESLNFLAFLGYSKCESYIFLWSKRASWKRVLGVFSGIHQIVWNSECSKDVAKAHTLLHMASQVIEMPILLVFPKLLVWASVNHMIMLGYDPKELN